MVNFYPNKIRKIKKKGMKKICLASWWNRFWAWLIDVLIMGAITGMYFLGTSREILTLNFLWNFGWTGILSFIYWTLLEGYNGQSIGKMALNLRVTDKKGEKIDYIKAAVESFGKAFLLPLDCLAGWLAMPRRRLRLFNRVSDTIVIKTKYEEPKGVEYVKEREKWK